MANYSKCPLYPKPRKGSNTTPNNYSTAVDSLIRPNTSFAQAAAPSNTRRNPAIAYQKQTNQIVTPTPIINNATYEVYIPPRSDERLFTQDLEQLLQTNSKCVIFGDLNATHNEWNCSVNSTRGNQLKTFTYNLNLTIAYPNSPTRFGYRTSNTLDIAVINNFNFPFTIDSIPELSSDHNPVFLNFSLTTPIHSDTSRAVTTCWSEFRNNLKKSVRLSDFSGIRNPNVLEENISYRRRMLRPPPSV
ncbi:RNA-directed DNA polymerase from mobile element jockey [Trichonephila clavipes]|uniref:RNA-directed DNA polymerase from mobile element jockey n=1 Tax=Trichonephila clavipes TaxID=2585209 RepID=A0A8X6SB40_TRICX|nr:RNA-directed DNA polymerase from mobile element jockey [Trichonephila clavipes]